MGGSNVDSESEEEHQDLDHSSDGAAARVRVPPGGPHVKATSPIAIPSIPEVRVMKRSLSAKASCFGNSVHFHSTRPDEICVKPVSLVGLLPLVRASLRVSGASTLVRGARLKAGASTAANAGKGSRSAKTAASAAGADCDSSPGKRSRINTIKSMLLAVAATGDRI